MRRLILTYSSRITMKVFALVLLVASFQLISADFSQKLNNDVVRDYVARAIGDKFKAVLEEFKKVMKTGNSSLGIPVLDPLDLEHQKINLDEEQITAKGELTDAHVEGLSDYVVKHADFKLAKWNVSMSFLWNSVRGKTSYEIDGYIANKIPVYGAGDISFDISEFAFATQAKLKVDVKTKKVKILNFNATTISVGKAKVDITGLYNDEDMSKLVSAIASDMVPDAVKDFHDEITAEVDKMLVKTANVYLDQYTLDDILALIS